MLEIVVAAVSLFICVFGASIVLADTIHAAKLLAGGPKLRWIGPPCKATYKPLHTYLNLYMGPEKWLVIKHRWRRGCYVVNLHEWVHVGCIPHETAESAFYKTAERFDTLEQAMLYFEMVRS